MAKMGLQATFKQMYAVFCNILNILVDIWTKSSLQQIHESILHVYSPQKPAENNIMDNYAYPVMSKKKVVDVHLKSDSHP